MSKKLRSELCYFWLPAGARRANVPASSSVDDPFPTAADVVELFRRWHRLLEPDGVELAVYNPRSLLADALPVFSWSVA